MDEILKWIGGLFIAASIFICLAGLYDLYKNGKRLTEEGVFKALGLAAIFVWIIIGFGVSSWLISVLYVGGAKFFWLVSDETKIPSFLVLASPIILLFILSITIALIKKRRDKFYGRIKSGEK